MWSGRDLLPHCYRDIMIRVRPEIDSLTTYDEGPGVEEIAHLHGVADIVQLSYNESPLPPFPEVQEAIAAHASGLNRYPDRLSADLTAALSKAAGVPGGWIWFGAGSSELLTAAARAVGGPGTGFVYAWPSFSMYPVNASLAATRSIRVPLDGGNALDLGAMALAVQPDTTLIYLCNPNNPTGTYRTVAEVSRFVDRVPEDVLVVLDEAYVEFVTAEDSPGGLSLAMERPNVVVARTFSKIYGLAGLRLGYMIGHPETLRPLRKAQIPFMVNSLAQVAALAALSFPERITERRRSNREAINHLETAFADRGIGFVPSQTNYIWTRLGPDTRSIIGALHRRGIIIRALADEWTRVTAGTPGENRRFITDLDRVLTSA